MEETIDNESGFILLKKTEIAPRVLIEHAMGKLFQDGDMVEIRALHPPDVPYVGRYLYGKELIDALMLFDTESNHDLYVMLNPTLLAAATMAQYMRGSRKADVVMRRWFLLDFDPIRKHKIATREQWCAANDLALEAQATLYARGWELEDVLLASSGNGVHLLVRCDLPNDAESEQTVKQVQRSIAEGHKSDTVLIECFPDSDRLTRAYGTLNRKGKEDDGRKYHRSRML